MNKDVAQQLTRARTALILDQPFFGELACRLLFVERPDIPTLAVDGRRIFYNPTFVQTLTPSLTKSALGHETMHCVYEHIGRRGDRDPKKWNFAGDFVINLALRDAGFEIGKGWLLDDQYAGMSTDHVYSLLPDNPDSEGPGEPGGPLDQVMDGDLEDREILAHEWKLAAIQAVNSAKALGKLPAGMERFIDELTTPKVDWREVLRRFVTQVSRNDYTWMRPNRRFLSAGFYMPSLYSESLGVLANGIDTSGSIDEPTLNVWGSEVTAAFNAAMPEEMHNIYCDSQVNHVDTFKQGELLHFEMHGGGGTDFRPPFEWIEEQGIRPACFIYLTDGYGPFPKTPPPYPVLWCMTTDVVAPWGQTLRIEV